MATLAPERAGRPTDHESFLVHKRFRWLWIALLLCVGAGVG